MFSDYVWTDFVNDFLEGRLDYLPKHYQKLLRDTLIKKHVYVKHGRNVSVLEALKECWNSSECPVIRGSTNPMEGVLPLENVKQEENKRIEYREIKFEAYVENEDEPKSTEQRSSRHNGITDVMKCMNKFDMFTGGYEENISELFEKYEALCDVVELLQEQMCK